MTDLKHISKKGNKFNNPDVYFGNTNNFSSFRDYAFGYFENNGIGIITFIRNLK